MQVEQIKEYAPSIVFGVTALIIFAAILFYRDKKIIFTLNKGNSVNDFNGRYIVYFLIFMLILSAISMVLTNFEYKYSVLILTVDIVLSVLSLGLVAALSSGIQDLYTLISLEAIILAILGFGCLIFLKHKFLKPIFDNTKRETFPFVMFIFLLIIFLSVIYMSWSDNTNKYGYYWTNLIIISIIIICSLTIFLVASKIYKFDISWFNDLNKYLDPWLFIFGKIIISALFSYGVLSHIE